MSRRPAAVDTEGGCAHPRPPPSSHATPRSRRSRLRPVRITRGPAANVPARGPRVGDRAGSAGVRASATDARATVTAARQRPAAQLHTAQRPPRIDPDTNTLPRFPTTYARALACVCESSLQPIAADAARCLFIFMLFASVFCYCFVRFAFTLQIMPLIIFN